VPALLGPHFSAAFALQSGFTGIGIGAWLGTIMLINVWVLIWPNQQKILGMVSATDEEKAKARRIAFLIMNKYDAFCPNVVLYGKWFDAQGAYWFIKFLFKLKLAA
jgi:uncharacterized membrane protein